MAPAMAPANTTLREPRSVKPADWAVASANACITRRPPTPRKSAPLTIPSNRAAAQRLSRARFRRLLARLDERDRDRHLAAQRGICGLELDHFDNPFVRHELHEAAAVRVGVRGRLAPLRRCVIGERDSEGATFAGVERMDVAGHAGRHHLLRDRARIEQRAIHARAGRVHAAPDAGRAHGLISRSRPSLFINFSLLSPPSAIIWMYVGSDSPPISSPAPRLDAPSFTLGRPSGLINRNSTVSGYGLPFQMTLGSSGSTDRLARTLPRSSTISSARPRITAGTSTVAAPLE